MEIITEIVEALFFGSIGSIVGWNLAKFIDHKYLRK